MKHLSGAIILCAAAALEISGISDKSMPFVFVVIGVMVLVLGGKK